jgi:hypothetical protein
MSALPKSAVGKDANQVLLSELRRRADRFLSLLESVPEGMRHIREADDTWSIIDCAEHVCLAEQLMFAAWEKRRPTDAAPELQKDPVIQQVALDRSRRLPCPEQARPTGRYASLAEAADAFQASRQRTIAFIESTNEDLRGSTCIHPMGVFDSYQLVIIMALHPERHALQIEQIRNSPAYRTAARN